MRDRVEVFGYIGVYHVGIAAAEKRMDFFDRVGSTPLRAIAVGAGVEIRFEERLKHQFGGGLYHPIPYSWNAEWPLAVTPGLRDHHPSHRCWSVRLLDQVLPDAGQPLFQPVCLDHREAYPVHPWRSLVRARQFIGMAQNVLAIDLVVEQVEAEIRLRLRLEIQLLLKPPDVIGCLQAHRQSPILVSVRSTPEVRVLPFAGITRFQQYYDPVRLPPEPLP